MLRKAYETIQVEDAERDAEEAEEKRKAEEAKAKHDKGKTLTWQE